MGKATKHLLIASAMALAILQPVATFAQGPLVQMARVESLSADKAMMQEGQDDLDPPEDLPEDSVDVDPDVVYAGTTVYCPSGRTFHISVQGGGCDVRIDTKTNVTHGVCRNQRGDYANANCHLNGGQGGCSSTSGSGDCR